MNAPIRIPERDPRNPGKTILVVILTLLVLGWFIWVLANWPASVAFVFR